MLFILQMQCLLIGPLVMSSRYKGDVGSMDTGGGGCDWGNFEYQMRWADSGGLDQGTEGDWGGGGSQLVTEMTAGSDREENRFKVRQERLAYGGHGKLSWTSKRQLLQHVVHNSGFMWNISMSQCQLSIVSQRIVITFGGPSTCPQTPSFGINSSNSFLTKYLQIFWS